MPGLIYSGVNIQARHFFIYLTQPKNVSKWLYQVFLAQAAKICHGLSDARARFLFDPNAAVERCIWNEHKQFVRRSDVPC